MKPLTLWLAEYGESHQNSRNQAIHEVCVPVIFFTVVGFLMLIPVAVGGIAIGLFILAAMLIWYATLGLRPFLVMAAALILCLLLAHGITMNFTAPFWLLLGLFVLAWIGQFWGHEIEGKKPSFFKDLQFLLIGPLWVVYRLAPRLIVKDAA